MYADGANPVILGIPLDQAQLRIFQGNENSISSTLCVQDADGCKRGDRAGQRVLADEHKLAMRAIGSGFDGEDLQQGCFGDEEIVRVRREKG
nr:hypothetical protein CFP56_74519 [Quercus suber]